MNKAKATDMNRCDICGKKFQDGARILPIQMYSIGKKGVRSIQPPHAYMHLHHLWEPIGYKAVENMVSLSISPPEETS